MGDTIYTHLNTFSHPFIPSSNQILYLSTNAHFFIIFLFSHNHNSISHLSIALQTTEFKFNHPISPELIVFSSNVHQYIETN